jgi:hypothetical protein
MAIWQPYLKSDRGKPFLRRIQKIHFSPENGWIEKLMVPSESAVVLLKKQWMVMSVGFNNHNFWGQFRWQKSWVIQTLKRESRNEIHWLFILTAALIAIILSIAIHDDITPHNHQIEPTQPSNWTQHFAGSKGPRNKMDSVCEFQWLFHPDQFFSCHLP